MAVKKKAKKATSGKKKKASGSRKKKSTGKKKGKTKEKSKGKKGAVEKKSQPDPDPFSYTSMLNACYISHGPVQFLEFRGYSWPGGGGAGKKKKKGGN